MDLFAQRIRSDPARGVGVTALTSVSRAAARLAAARESLEAAIRDARAQGLSLRAIGEAAGLTHQTIRVILARPSSTPPLAKLSEGSTLDASGSDQKSREKK
jgi:hypothetical protein